MRLLASLLRIEKRNKRKTVEEYQREAMVRIGREQFKKLADQGLSIPVGML